MDFFFVLVWGTHSSSLSTYLDTTRYTLYEESNSTTAVIMARLCWAGEWDIRQRSRCPRDSYSKNLGENGRGKIKIRMTEGNLKER